MYEKIGVQNNSEGADANIALTWYNDEKGSLFCLA